MCYAFPRAFQVLGVAVIVPNAHFPGAYAHPSLVMLGDVLAAAMAVSIKMSIFDIEPVSMERSAFLVSRWRGALGRLLSLSVAVRARPCFARTLTFSPRTYSFHSIHSRHLQARCSSRSIR